MPVTAIFEIGYMAVLVPIIFCVIYLVFRKVRQFGAWAKRGDPPKERVGVFLIMAAILVFIVGAMSQNFVDLGIACNQSNQPVITCVFANT